MRRLKHLPVKNWPEADQEAFRRAYFAANIFDEDGGPGAHHSKGWRRMIETTWRRWLGFLAKHHASELLKLPSERITPELMRAFVEHLSLEVRATTVAMAVAHLYAAARLIAPEGDWRWLRALKMRLAARALPEDRFNRLVSPWETLDLGIAMMEEAATLPVTAKVRDLHYRDGLLISFVSTWPLRRRSLARSQ